MDVLKKVVSAAGHRTRYVLVTRKISLVLLFSCVRRRDWARALRAVLLRRSILKYRLSRSIPERTKIKQTEKRLADWTTFLSLYVLYCTTISRAFSSVVCLFMRSPRQENIFICIHYMMHLYTNGRYNEKLLQHSVPCEAWILFMSWRIFASSELWLGNDHDAHQFSVDLDAVHSVLAPPEVFGHQPLIFEEAPSYN